MEENQTLKLEELRVAERINPTVRGYTNHGQSGIGMNTSVDVLPTADKILKDAQVIYDWLVK